MTVGPFTVQAVERRVGAGGYPNTSGNPFRRTPVTTCRVLHQGVPALLLMHSGAVLLTELGGQPHCRALQCASGRG